MATPKSASSPAPSPPISTAAKKAPSAKEAALLSDANAVRNLVAKHAKDFVAADKDRKAKRIDAKFRARLDADLATLGVAKQAQKKGTAKQQKARADEEEQRIALHEALVSIRDDIETSYPDDVVIQKTFGRGRSLGAHHIAGLASFAEALAIATADAATAKRASDAGVSKKRLDHVQALASKLDLAKSSAADAGLEKKGASKGKKAALDRVIKDVAYARKVASVVFKGNAAVLATFKSTLATHAVKKRAAKSTS
ncbi:MAG: hypothetical protein ACHREM_15655 [Polyangiales bacterium]